MKKLKTIIYSTLASLSLLFPIAVPVAVNAQEIDKNLQCGANLQFSVPENGCEVDSSGNTAAERIDEIVSQIINILSLAVGVVAVVMIIVGGFRYITSGGDSGNVTGAKNTILYAVVGLVVVALAQVIVRFVVDKATQKGVTTSGD
ncbi:MAG: hypothetical protein Q7T41_00470 [Candidatus Saccharibacteria bacterium]|nr:hypothetical protein [Candidatus Saccharibacteria bacterium]